MQLSPHFSLEEMIISQEAARRGIDNTPPASVIEELKLLTEQLEKIRALLKQPLLISSGYRCPKLNLAIGGTPNSAHILGRAADFILPPRTPLDICRIIEATTLPFDQLILEHGWVHFAIAPEPRRDVLTLQADGSYAKGLAISA